MVYYSNNLTLFSSEIDPRRNLFIDDIEQYLASLSNSVTLEDFKRFTPSETVSVRVAVTDAQMAFGAYLTSRWNYARVLYEDDSSKNSYFWYYFVTSIETVADGTLAVSLQLDALNTFRNWKGALTDRTFVARQLVNRWDGNGYPLTDFTPEDISGEIVKETKLGFTPSPGYLVYRNTDGATPALYMVKDSAMSVADSVLFDEAVALPGGKFLEGGYGLRFTAQGAVTVTLTYDVNGTAHVKSKAYSSGESATVWFARTYTQDGIDCYWGGGSVVTAPTKTFSLRIEGTFSGTMLKTTIDQAYSPTHTDLGSSSMTIDGIDRTESDICKIIKIPYVYAGGGYFTVRGSAIIYRFPDLEPGIEQTVGYILLPSPWAVTKASYSTRDDDPKIWSGAYCYIKVYYDSYSTTIALDNMVASNKGFAKPKVTFAASSSMSSSCVFRVTDENGWANVKEDFPFMISSDRNNELPLYSSEWLNYMRVGYNYDKKSNALSMASGILSTISSAVLGIASIANGGATLPVAVGMAGNAVSAFSGGVSVVNSQSAKEAQMRTQSYSVSAINDLSLFEWYGNGEVKYDYWKPKAEYEERLASLFFYRGYAVNRQYEPSLDIRTSFDYIECVPSWSGSFIQRTPPQFISLLSDRLAQGVTIIHHYENAWDIAQEKGNIEK